jgi:prephenate dehydrogenase
MNIGIVGLGLIGGSLGRTIIGHTKDTVFAYDVSDGAMKTGKLLSAFHYELDQKSLKKLDVIFFTLYPDALERALDEYCPLLKDGCLVVDCCGNKRRVVSQMKRLSEKYKNLEFISSHPMAGREFSGVSHSTANLFERASMILVPVNATLKTTAFLKEYCKNLGFGSVVITTAEEHDRIIAFTSQLAHLVSSAYIKSDTASSFMGFSAGSFRDMTRVARLSPEMWAQLTVDNSDFLVNELNSIIGSLNEYKSALEQKDIEKMKSLLADGNERKLISEKNRRVFQNENQ